MESFLVTVFIIIPIAILTFVLPIVAVVKASRVKRRLTDLEATVQALSSRMSASARQKERLDVPAPVAPEETQVVREETPVGSSEETQVVRKETPVGSSEETQVVREETSEDSTKEAPIFQEKVETGKIDVPGERAAAYAVQKEISSRKSEEAAHEKPKKAPRAAGASIEERIGVVWFTRIGAVVGMAAAAWFFKYMVDNDWIGPWGRIAAGAVAGLLFLGLGEFLYRRKRTHPVFNQGLLGFGLALLLITAYASFGFYHLVSVITAFGIVAVLCLLGGALSHFHKSEIILVFSLLAAFLNPIMLSAGLDRPGALFTYLLLMTGAAYVPAVIHGFKTATFIAASGVVLLFTGWYARFFDIRPALPGIYDNPEFNRPGAYFDIAARWIPLLFSVLFTGEWIAAALLHMRKARRVTGFVLLLIAAAASHGVSAALLYDHPLLLGVVLLAFGLLFAVLFVRNNLTQWLFLPMTSSFAILACLKGQMNVGDLLPLMIVSGLLSALYFCIFLRVAVQQDRRPSPVIKLLIAGAGLGFFLLGVRFLMPEHPLLWAGFAAVLTGVFLLTSAVISSPFIAAGASAAGFIGLLISNAQRPEEMNLQLIAVAGGWFVLHTVLIAYDALKRKRDWPLVHLLILSFAGIGFTGLFISASPPESEILRALLSLGEGVLYLLVGMLSVRRAAGMKRSSLLPLGMAAAAFTLAAGFLLSGASLTAAWAAEAVVLAYLATRVRDKEKGARISLLISSIVLFHIAVIHMFIMDAVWISGKQMEYLDTAGASGVLLPTAFAHPAAWGLAAGAAAFLLSFVFLRKSKNTFGKVTGIGFLIAGHGVLLRLLINEFSLMFTAKPNIPLGIPKDELLVLWSKYQSVVLGQSMQLETITTVVMGIFALLLIMLGFVIRDAWHRRMGMVLFAGTLIKLCFFDIWNFETLFRIIVGGAVALLLLTGGFLYARFGHRLKAIVSDKGGKALGVIVLLAFTSAAVDASALEVEKYQKSATVLGIEAPGDYVLEISPELYQASTAATPLADIRIVGPDGAEAPFTVFSAEPSKTPTIIDAQMLDPQTLPDGAFRAVLDLGESPPVHDRVRLRLSGDDYLRTAMVESGDDGKTFGVLAKDKLVYNIPSARIIQATQSILDYPKSQARYLRITIQKGMDASNVRITSAQCEAARKSPILDGRREISLPLETVFEDTDKRTVYPMAALPKKIPFDALRIETDGREFARQVKVETSTHKNAWFSAGPWSVYRIRRGSDTTESIAERLGIPTGRLQRPYVRLKIDNGDNRPLNISAVFAQYTAEALVLRAATPGPHTLYAKRADARPPKYDLAALFAKGSFSKFKPASLGPLEDNPRFQKIVPAPKAVPWTETHARLIQIAVLVISLLLLLWTVQLLRKSKK